MDKIKQNIDLQNAIQAYNIEKSVVGTLAYSIEQNIQKGMSPDEAIDNVLQKSKSYPIGTIHNGFKKIAEGKWRKVSEHGMTKEEHEYKGKHGGDSSYKHTLISDKLDSKDYSDEEVGLGGEKKEKFNIGDRVIVSGFNTGTGSKIHYGKIDKINGEDIFIEGLVKPVKIHNIKLNPNISKSEQTEAQKAKVKKVMDEWKAGKLKSSSGEKVVDQKMALAIALSEAGLSKED